MDKYEKIKKIGRGTYGDVLLVKRKSDGKLLALKKVALENLIQSSSSSGRESTATKQTVPAPNRGSSTNTNMVNTKSDTRQMKLAELATTHFSEKKKGEEAQLGASQTQGDWQAQTKDQEKPRASLPSKNNKRFVFEAEDAGAQENSQHSQSMGSGGDVSKNSSEETQKALNNEIQILKTLHHPNIIRYYESFKYKKHLCIVTEYAQNGDLQRKIKDAKNGGKKLSQQQILIWFCQLALALGHIHSKNILHRDLKPKNILLTKNNEVKIGDFGISKMLENTFDMAKTATGTPYYLSPEVCLGQRYDNKSDMWMLGCILYEMCALRRPFEGESLNQVLNKILKEDPKKLSNDFDPIFHRLTELLLQKTASLRASIQEILDLPEIRDNIERMKSGKLQQSTQASQDSLKIQYIQPISQKKHSQMKDQKGISINNFLLVNQSHDVEESSPLDAGNQTLSSNNKSKQSNTYLDYRSSSKKQILFDGELTFGGESKPNQRTAKSSAPPKKMNKVNSAQECNSIIIQESPASFFAQNDASARSAHHQQEAQNAYQSNNGKDMPNVGHPSSTAEYQGYYDCRPHEQSRTQSQLVQNPKAGSNHSVSRHNKLKVKMMNNISLYNSLNDGVGNNSSHNIMYQGDQSRYSPMAQSASQRSQKPYHSQNRSLISQSSNEKDLNRKQKIQDLLKKAKNLTSPNQGMDLQGRDFAASKDRDADQGDEVDSGTILQKIDCPNEQEEALFGSRTNQPRSPEKFVHYQDEDTEEQQEVLLKSANCKAWLSAERSGNFHESNHEENDAYRSVIFANNNFHQSVHSPNIEDLDKSADRRLKVRAHLNESSNQIYNQGCGQNDSMQNHLDISGISNRPFRPSSQISDENQNIDDRDSEQIGKRTTIHSMLSVLSLFSGQNPGQHQSQKSQGKISSLKPESSKRGASRFGEQVPEQATNHTAANKPRIHNKQLINNDGYNKRQNQQILRELKTQKATYRKEDPESQQQMPRKQGKSNQLVLKRQQKSSQDNLNDDKKISLVKQPSVFNQEQRQSVDHIAHKVEGKQTSKIPSNVVARYIPQRAENVQQDAAQPHQSGHEVNETKMSNAGKHTVVKIKQPNQSDIEVKFSKNKSKVNYIKKPEKQGQKKAADGNADEGSKTMSASQSSLPQALNNANSIFNKKSIQINTNLEPSQSKKQYEMALAQAKQYIKQQSDSQKKLEAKMSSGTAGDHANVPADAQKQPKDKKQNQSCISCGNITLLNMKNSGKSQLIDKQNSNYIQQDQQARDRHLHPQFQLLKTPENHQLRFNQSSGVINAEAKKVDTVNLSQMSPGSFYTPNSFYQQPSFKTLQNRLLGNGSERSGDNGSISAKSGASSDTQINNISNIDGDKDIARDNHSSVFAGAAQSSNLQHHKMVQMMPIHPKTITNMSLKSKIIRGADPRNAKAADAISRSVLGHHQNNFRINISAQKSSSTTYEQVVSQNQGNQFVISNNHSPFSSLRKQQAKTPQDNAIKSKNHLFNSNYSGSGDRQDESMLLEGVINRGSNDGMSEEKAAIDNRDNGRKKYTTNGNEAQMPLLSQQKRKQVYTTTNQQKQGQIGGHILSKKKEVITSKSGLVQHQMVGGHDQYANQPHAQPRQQQTKYFTFDQNGIFNPRNPVSPARGHLATEFVKQRLGKPRYDQILKILNESDNPIRLLDVHGTPQDQNDAIHAQQMQILRLINNDSNFLSILQYIVNCSMCFRSGNEQQSGKDSSQNKSQTGSKEEGQSTSQVSMAQTPNSGFTLNSNYCAGEANKSVNVMKGGTGSFTKKMSYDSSGVDEGASTTHRININKQNSIGQYSSDIAGLGLVGLGSAKSGPDGVKMQFHRPQDSINSIGTGKKVDNQHKLFTPSTQYTNNLGKQSDKNPLRIKQRRQTFQISQSNISDQIQQLQVPQTQVNNFNQIQDEVQDGTTPLGVKDEASAPSGHAALSKTKQQTQQQSRTPGQQQPPSLRQLFKQRDISIEKYKIQLPGSNTDKNAKQAPMKDFRVKSNRNNPQTLKVGKADTKSPNDVAVFGAQRPAQHDQQAHGHNLEEPRSNQAQGPLTTPSQVAQNNKITSQYQNLTSDEQRQLEFSPYLELSPSPHNNSNLK